MTTQTAKGASPHELWSQGSDTYDISRELNVSEAQVYNSLRSGLPANPPAAPVVPAAKPKPNPRKPVVVPPQIAAPVGYQYRLRDGTHYLHESGQGLTPDPSFAWKGSAEKALACCAKYRIAKNMVMEIIL
jgi:hypothetical protein